VIHPEKKSAVKAADKMRERAVSHVASNAGPRSPTRTLSILELVAESNGQLTLAQLSHRLAIPKTSSFNLLRPLVAQNYLTCLDGKYFLGPGTYRLTFMAKRSSFLKSVRPALERLAADTGETVSLGMLDLSERQLEYMDVVESTRSVRYVVKTGDRRPLYCVSSGLVLLAWQSPEAVAHYLDSTPLVRLTASTIVDRPTLIERLAEVRAAGYVVSAAGYSDEVFGFAAPIFSHPDRVVAALAIGAPVSRAFQNKEAYVDFLTRQAKEVSRMFSASS